MSIINLHYDSRVPKPPDVVLSCLFKLLSLGIKVFTLFDENVIHGLGVLSSMLTEELEK